MAEKKETPLYQPHPSKAAQIAERAEHDARLRELARTAKTETGEATDAPPKGGK